MTAPSGRRSALRRYPALAFLVAAGLLALLLPSSLRLPLSGPPSVAELAPVPLQGSVDVNGDLSAIGQVSGAGLGNGRGTRGGGATTTEPSHIVQGRPRAKRCVGNPLRQTEDPLSPPCVAFFEGDNGGATAKGVTRSEITVVTFLETAGEAGYDDWLAPVGSNETSYTRVGKALTRYFNARYQTYGRTVHVFAFHGGGDKLENLRASIARIDAEKRPFAVIPLMTSGVPVVAQEVAQRGSFAATFTGFARSVYTSNAPRIVSFRPDLEDEVALAATFVCTKLAGRPVKQGDPGDLGKTRKFGILWSDRPDEPSYRTLAELARSALQKQCGQAVAMASTTQPNVQSSAQENAVALASLRSEGVTTVIPFSADGIFFSHNEGWYPEWFVPGTAGVQQIDTNATARLLGQSQWRNALGISFDRRRGRLEDQEWFQAFSEGCPECQEPTTSNVNPALYEAMTMLMYGIQAAGPRLSVATIDKGMHAIVPRASPDPFTPAAYFGPGSYSFEKDAMEIWWDPAGKDPASTVRGCYRLPRDGSRSRAGEWPPGDDDAFVRGICQGSYGR